MKLFPKKDFIAELNENSSIAMTELKRNTDITNSLVSDWTKKAFRGEVSENGFKIISSEIGRGAVCVLIGKFDENTVEIEVRIHNAFKVMFSIIMLYPFIMFGIIYYDSGLEKAVEYIPFLIIAGLAIRFVFIELSFRFISRTGLNKLTKIIGIKQLKKNEAQHRI